MNLQTSPETQQSLIGMGTRLPGCWQLGHGRAVSLLPREAGVLRVAHGRVWATLDELTGDHVLHAGVPRDVCAWTPGFASTQSGMPKLVSSALTCGPGRITTPRPAARAVSKNAARSRSSDQSNASCSGS